MKDLPLNLEKILGLTSLSNTSLLSLRNGDIIYAAGCIAVLYDPSGNKQKQYFKTQLSIACMTLSSDEKYLAIGERGHNARVVVFDVFSGSELAALEMHKHGVGCVAFSPDGMYLVSASFKVDKQLCIWEWKSKICVSTHKIGNKVHSLYFHTSGNFFVTCGDRHLKWWYLDYEDAEIIIPEEGGYFSSPDTISSRRVKVRKIVQVTGKPACILDTHSQSNFVDLFIDSASNTQANVYCITAAGLLCLFNSESRMMVKYVGVESSTAYCLSGFRVPIAGSGSKGGVSPLILFIGCADGIVRTFLSDHVDGGLNYISTLPLPAPLHLSENTFSDAELTVDFAILHPSCIGVRVSGITNGLSSTPGSKTQLTCIYADRSFFTWDIAELITLFSRPVSAKDLNDIDLHYSKIASWLSHRSCIWDVQFVDQVAFTTNPVTQLQERSSLPPGSMVTCSSDGSIRFWDVNSKKTARSTEIFSWRNMYSAEMLHAIEIAPTSENFDASFSSKNKAKSPYVAVSGSPARKAGATLTSSVNINLSSIQLNTEIPDRFQDDNAARAFAIHPSGQYVACGDKHGTMRVYYLKTMALVQVIPAHVAEILAMCYSPLLFKTYRDSENGREVHWNVSSEESGKEGVEETLVLLATAGRDRLVHILDASIPGKYVPLITLDNHSASVTAIKFTLDGRRLLSCGGDKTIVFCDVNGPIITRSKSVNTSHGTIVGLAIDATNKYAATTGQDRKLNIWNIKSGKFMRSYKDSSVVSELYKCDIDPSGMYVAASTFDKKICIFDFFSGQLIAFLDSGHSEIITSIRFSPNGKHLVTVGGDGCLLVWRLGNLLVKSMQERIMELYADVRKKQELLRLSTDSSVRGSLGLPSAPHEVLMPPAPPIEGGSKSKLAPSVLQAANVRASGLNKWAQRNPPNDANRHSVEMFGRNVDVGDNRHKLTLELTGTVGLNGTVPVEKEMVKHERVESAIKTPPHLSRSNSSTSRLAVSVEDAFDEVIRGDDSDNDTVSGDESHADLQEEQEDTEKSAMLKLNSLESSVSALEDWLEKKLRTEVVVDDSVDNRLRKSIADSSTDDTALLKEVGNILSRSPSKKEQNTSSSKGSTLKDGTLSSEFFSKEILKPKQAEDITLPENEVNTTISSAASKIENRRRETEAAVSLMRDRLLSMGILDQGADADNIASSLNNIEALKSTKRLKTFHDKDNSDVLNVSNISSKKQIEEISPRSSLDIPNLEKPMINESNISDFTMLNDTYNSYTSEDDVAASIAVNADKPSLFGSMGKGTGISKGEMDVYGSLDQGLAEMKFSGSNSVSSPLKSPSSVKQSLGNLDGNPNEGLSKNSVEDSVALENKMSICKKSISDLVSATADALKAYEELKKLRATDSKNGNASLSDSLSFSLTRQADPSSSKTEVAGKATLMEEADNVLFQFENSFVNLADSAVELFCNSGNDVNLVHNSIASSINASRASGLSFSTYFKEYRQMLQGDNRSSDYSGIRGSFSEMMNPTASLVRSSMSTVAEDEDEMEIVTDLSKSAKKNTFHDGDTEDEGETGRKTSSNSSSGIVTELGKSNLDENALISMFLDKYSDRLVDALSEKLKGKVGNK